MLRAVKILVAACGSRGDFQPMLAFAVALRRRGHEVTLGATPCFAEEAANFGIPFSPVGIDIQKLLADNKDRISTRSPMKALRFFNETLKTEAHQQLEQLLPLAANFDAVTGGGALIGARTAAEANHLPYLYVGYTPQMLPVSNHPPFMVPFVSTPAWMNVMFWAFARRFYNRLARPILDPLHQRLGLEPVTSVLDWLFDPRQCIVACDPELKPVPPPLTVPQVGSFALEDTRPLPAEVDAFLAAGPPPLYIGFGSMPDDNAAETSSELARAIELAGCRAIVSTGWAGLGGFASPDILTVGPVTHGLLFPRVAAIVHHGGAGTSAAAARAGVPQVVVPHAFDQFANAHAVQMAGLGTVVRRKDLTAGKLADAVKRVTSSAEYARRASEAGARIRARDPLTLAAEILEERARAVPAAAAVHAV